MLARRSDAGFALVYFLLGAFYILVFQGSPELPAWMAPVVKTIPVWMLVGLALWRLPAHPGGRFLALGVGFGSVGDFVLSASWISHSFLIGLGFFLVGHLLYVLAFGRVFRYRLSRLILVGLVAIGMIGLVAVIYPKLTDEFRLPVLAYIFVIFLMNFFAAFRRYSFLGVFAGAVIFLVSDALIALRKFTGMQIREPAVMITYYLAQFLIIMGSISDAEIEAIAQRPESTKAPL